MLWLEERMDEMDDRMEKLDEKLTAVARQVDFCATKLANVYGLDGPYRSVVRRQSLASAQGNGPCTSAGQP